MSPGSTGRESGALRAGGNEKRTHDLADRCGSEDLAHGGVYAVAAVKDVERDAPWGT
jgi:hypothetical protein